MIKEEKIDTPYYLIDESYLLSNLKKAQFLREKAGVKILLATKCFSTFAVFPLFKKYIDGTSSSSLYETKLGYDKIGREVFAYCVGFKENEIKKINKISDKIIFNSLSQLNVFYDKVDPEKIGLRINPGISYSKYDLADPNRVFSRLGETNYCDILNNLSKIKGVMFHFNCENEDFENLKQNIEIIEQRFSAILNKVSWVNLGGGIRFTSETFPLFRFALLLKKLSEKYGVQIYLEPGEALVKNSAKLVTTVVDVLFKNNSNFYFWDQPINSVDDIVSSGRFIVVVDASVEAHMPDVLIYQDYPIIRKKDCGSYKSKFECIITGRSCLAGDIFGEYTFDEYITRGERLEILDAGSYTIVKKNWFNGLQMPSIVVKRLNGKLKIIRKYKYKDFLKNNS